MYLQVLSFDRDNVIARNQLGVVERELRDRQYLQLVEQIDDYDEAFSIGVAARRQGDAKLAVAALRRALKIKPTSYAMNALAAAHRADHNLGEAEVVYKTALASEPNPASKVGLAAVYFDRGWLSKAKTLYEEVLREDGANAHALHGLGAVYAKLGSFEDAELCFTRAAGLADARDESMSRLSEPRKSYSARGNRAGAARVDALLRRIIATSGSGR